MTLLFLSRYSCLEDVVKVTAEHKQTWYRELKVIMISSNHIYLWIKEWFSLLL